MMATPPPFDVPTVREFYSWHVVKVTDKRIECVPGCEGAAPHLSEYRAPDVNPNR